MFEKQCERSAMSCECEAIELVKQASGPAKTGGSVKAAIAQAARSLGWKFSRTREIWYGRARRIEAREMDQLRQLAMEQAGRYRRIAEAMRATDPDFYQSDISALVSAARQLGGEDQS